MKLNTYLEMYHVDELIALTLLSKGKF